MYISCPECKTKFIVRPEQIGAKGRKVKCSKCDNIWHQTPLKPEKIEPLLTPIMAPTANIPIGNGVNLPALLPIRIPIYLYVMPGFLLIGIIMLIIAMFPEKVGFETIMNDKYINLKDISIENRHDLDKLTVKYKILNTAKSAVKMPLVRIRLFDKDSRLLNSKVDDNRHVELAPNQFVMVRTEFSQPPKNTSTLDLTLGTSLDFIMR